MTTTPTLPPPPPRPKRSWGAPANTEVPPPPPKPVVDATVETEREHDAPTTKPDTGVPAPGPNKADLSQAAANLPGPPSRPISNLPNPPEPPHRSATNANVSGQIPTTAKPDQSVDAKALASKPLERSDQPSHQPLHQSADHSVDQSADQSADKHLVDENNREPAPIAAPKRGTAPVESPPMRSRAKPNPVVDVQTSAAQERPSRVAVIVNLPGPLGDRLRNQAEKENVFLGDLVLKSVELFEPSSPSPSVQSDARNPIRRRKRVEGASTVTWYSSDAERSALDALAHKAGLTRSAFVTAALEQLLS